MRVVIEKDDNHAVLPIPDEVLRATGLEIGSQVEIRASSLGLAICKSAEQPSLEELLEQVEPEHLHSECDWGNDVGKEKLGWE